MSNRGAHEPIARPEVPQRPCDLRKASGTNRESVVREALKTLLKDWGKSEGLLFIPNTSTRRTGRAPLCGRRAGRGPDAAAARLWEAKDTNDDLDAEIAKKLRRGYPQDNIIFEDSETAS